MNLMLRPAWQAALFAFLEQLEDLGVPAVLVGGLVPPLLLEHLDPEGFMFAPVGRNTADCDVAVGIDEAAPGRLGSVNAILSALGWRPDRATQFRWVHPSTLLLDLIPVPAGIEACEPAAVAQIAAMVVRDVARFFRGYELALATAISITVVDAEGTSRNLRIASLPALLAMKLQARADRPERLRDAHDVAWLLRHLEPRIVVAALEEGRSRRPDLVAEVLERLRADFSRPDDRGVYDYVRVNYHGYGDYDADTEPDRNAVAAAVHRILSEIGRVP